MSTQPPEHGEASQPASDRTDTPAVRPVARTIHISHRPADGTNGPDGTNGMARVVDPAASNGTGNGVPPPAQRVIQRGGPTHHHVDWHEARSGTLPGNRYVRVLRAKDQKFRQVSPDYLVAGESLYAPRGRWGKMRRFLVGRPIATEHQAHERLTKVKALAIFSSDALSSVAYATEAILAVLVLAGAAALGVTIPISIGIAVLLAIVGVSYRQTIRAYPNGASAYLVAKANLGPLPSLAAGASLLIDYILTVAVSVSAGVAAITSALPGLVPSRIEICLAFVGLIILGNLRGLRESGSIFAVPTYLFIVSIGALVALGVVRSLTGNAIPEVHSETLPVLEPLSVWLVLRAFTAGCTALTGVEAISDGVPAFKPPEAKNAATTLTVMCVILGAMFIGLSYLAHEYQIVPREEETVVSQIARATVGDGLPYYFIQAMTALILILAANTSFADFPRLSTWLARDGFLPRQFLFRGDRLAFNTGIFVLGVLSALLIIGFGGQEERLLPLYAVGVFTAFTLSQGGMVVHWWRERGSGWTWRFVLNLVGASATFFVLILVVATKFTGGAWAVLVLMPLIIVGFKAIHKHYAQVREQVRLTDDDLPPPMPPMREQVVIVPISDVNKITLNALNYARTMSHKVIAVHVTEDAEAAGALQARWERYGEGVNLVILESPYRSLAGPLLSYIDLVHRKRPHDLVTVVVPEYVPNRWWEQTLHSQTALRLKAALLFRSNTVVVSVPYHEGSR